MLNNNPFNNTSGYNSANNSNNPFSNNSTSFNTPNTNSTNNLSNNMSNPYANMPNSSSSNNSNNSNNFYSKDTLFNDLPSDLKKKLVDLRNLSQLNYTFPKTHPLLDHGYTSIPSSEKYQEQFYELVGILRDIQNNTSTNNTNSNNKLSTEDHFAQESDYLMKFMNIYKNNQGNHSIVDEYEKTISMMDEKYREISAKHNKRT